MKAAEDGTNSDATDEVKVSFRSNVRTGVWFRVKVVSRGSQVGIVEEVSRSQTQGLKVRPSVTVKVRF